MTSGEVGPSRSLDGRLQPPVGGSNSSNILHLCLLRNQEIANILNDHAAEHSNKDQTLELRKNNEAVTRSLTRCTTDYGDVDDMIDIAVVEPFYRQIIKYKEKLMSFTERRGLGQLMWQGRYVKKMDYYSNAISLKLVEIDKILRQTALERLKHKETLIFREIMEEINQEEPSGPFKRTNSILGRKSRNVFDWSSVKSSDVKRRHAEDHSIIKGEERHKLLSSLR